MPRITTEYRGDMLFESTIGNHTLQIDVPEPMGGKDRGPMPSQLFVASLGSCVAALIASYCRRQDVDCSGLTVDVDFERDFQPTRLTEVQVTIRLPNATCDEALKRKAMLHAAQFCPVHEAIETLERVNFDIRVGDE